MANIVKIIDVERRQSSGRGIVRDRRRVIPLTPSIHRLRQIITACNLALFHVEDVVKSRERGTARIDGRAALQHAESLLEGALQQLREEIRT